MFVTQTKTRIIQPAAAAAADDDDYDDDDDDDDCDGVARKLPRGVHKGDFARPLYRRDIFYSGSLLHVDKFYSAPDVHKYVKSVTSVPGSMEPERSYTLCHCIPISKASYDTLTQASETCYTGKLNMLHVLHRQVKRVTQASETCYTGK